MPSTEKLEKVSNLKQRIEGSEAILLTEYRGLTVQDATELRRALSEQAQFAVVKNTLMKRAADEAGLGDIESLLTGPTAVAFVKTDVIAAAKKVVDAAKRFPALVIKGAWMEGRVLSGEEARGLADLESREVMLSKLAGLMKAEMSRAAGMFQAVQSRFLGVLEAHRDKVSGEAPQPGASTSETDDARSEGSAEAQPQDVPAGDGELGERAEETPEASTPGAEGPPSDPSDEQGEE